MLKWELEAQRDSPATRSPTKPQTWSASPIKLIQAQVVEVASKEETQPSIEGKASAVSSWECNC